MDNTKPSIKEIVYVAPQKDWSFPLHSHEASAELSLVIGGRGTFYAINEQCLIHKGMIVAKNPRMSHSEKSDPDEPLEQICIEVENIHIDGFEENFVIPDGSDPVIELGEFYELFESSFRFFMRYQNDPVHKATCSRLMEIVLDLLQEKVRSAKPPVAKPRNKKELVSELLNYLDSHYKEKLRIKDLADMFFVSEGNLSRQFKAVTGYTVNEYIISKRMGEAQRLLIYSDEDIKDVARLCGYEDLQYFYHVFRSFAHCTPAEFRAKYRQQ